MQRGQAARTCSMNMHHKHSMDIQVYISRTLSMNMQKERDMQHGHGQTADTCSTNMQHEHAAWTCSIVIVERHWEGLAARTGSIFSP
jgi:hypothetical protein